MKKHRELFLVILIGLFFLFSYQELTRTGYLQFSDGAKFADVARSIVKEGEFKLDFSFFGNTILQKIKSNNFGAFNVSPIMPYAISIGFRLFGINDSSVILTSGFFYLLLISFTFLLGRKLFGSLGGFLSAIAVASNVNLLDYATSGASEILLAFLIVLAAYLIILRKNWTDLSALLMLFLMYLTKPLSFIYIIGLVFYWLTLKTGIKRSLQIFTTSVLVIVLLDIVLSKIIGERSFFYPLYIRGLQAANYYAAGQGTSNALRGGVIERLGLLGVAKKAFFHLYNFYKALPQIASPYIWGLFVIGLFVWGKEKLQNDFKILSFLMAVGAFLVAAATIPLYRYIHPVIPLVYLMAIGTLVWIVKLIVDGQWIIIRKNKLIKKWGKEKLIAKASLLLILFFVVGQTLGIIFVDSRFWRARRNIGMAPIYVVLSQILKEETELNDIIVTNLDTWGSWYGERKTVWFPLNPEQLDLGDEEVHFDAIYLTNYLIDDENYYMGDEWRQIFDNPGKPENKFIKENFELKGIYEITAEETYERQEGRAVLLVRKQE